MIKVDPFVSVNGIKFKTAREKVHEISGKPEDEYDTVLFAKKDHYSDTDI
ncbi:hypothetical protein [Ruminococcus sp.]|nr:hypothetical protein [Ruminococcus sp.]MBO5558195.1 hypothetical protein [Ruminococcus sp.]